MEETQHPQSHRMADETPQAHGWCGQGSQKDRSTPTTKDRLLQSQYLGQGQRVTPYAKAEL